MFGCCGNNCSECGAYIATRDNNDKLRAEVAAEWSVEYNTPFTPEQINCVGCTAEGVHVGFAEHACTLRKCCMGKDQSTCAECKSYPCDELAGFFGGVPEAKVNLDSIRE
jgi:hypothetical protein